MKLFTDYYLHVTAEDGKTIRCKVSGGDGYDETARLSVEMTLLLATARDALPFSGGILTPAVAGGQKFVEAVRRTGVTFEVLPNDFKVDFSKVNERLA